MAFDDIIIGSGLTALATAMGLAKERRILVIGGPESATLEYYDSRKTTPLSYRAFGGLGKFWHGVVASSASAPYVRDSHEELEFLFRAFYPRTDIVSKIGKPWLFIPRRPIRTPLEWKRLEASRDGKLDIRFLTAQGIECGDGCPSVSTNSGKFRAKRIWIAAGTLYTPNLLADSFDRKLARGFVSDHVICYAGQLDRVRHPQISKPIVEYAPEGFWLETVIDGTGRSLFMSKPARFDYKKLDHGIQQRSAFGLPTGGTISKLLKSSSLGLVSEGLFNRFGVFPNAKKLNVYAQVLVEDAFHFDGGGRELRPVENSVANAMARVSYPWGELDHSRRRDLFIRGIHLHHSIDLDALEALGFRSETSTIKVVDPSVLSNIGPEHHSFYAMSRAFKLARQSCQ